VDGYDLSKGVKFSTYATHFVIGQIKHYLRDRGKIIKEPAWLQELNQRMSRVIESLTQELGRVPTNGEIAHLMGTTEETVADLLTTREVFKVASLDGGSETDDDSPATYDMERVKGARQVEFEVPVADKLVLETSLRKLKDLEQAVIHEFFYKERSQTEIAREMGISCNYVSHILRNSTKKLRKMIVSDDLRESQIEMSHLRRRNADPARAIAETTIVDGLTHLYNRRYFDMRLDEEISRASRFGYLLSVMFLWLDGHERLHRAYGTLRSEDTLRYAASLIRASVRKADIVTRYGPAVFGLILPHTGPQVEVVAGRLTSVVDTWLESAGLNHGPAPIALAIGHAHYPGQGADARRLVDLAQEMLEQRRTRDALGRAA
jgi:RNA polymerase sigma-B factor